MLKKVTKLFILFGILFFSLICVSCKDSNFTPEEMIIEAYCNDVNSHYGFKKISTKDVKIKYFLEMYPYYVTIDDKTFEFWNIPEIIVVVYESKCYSLLTACEVGGTLEDVAKLNEYCNKYIWHKSISFLSINFNGSFNGLNGDEQIVGIFNTKKEIIEIFSKYDISWIDVPFWDEFSDNFFDNNAIVIYFSWFNGGNVERSVESIYYKDEKITIKVSQKFDETVEDIVVFYPIILQVNKKFSSVIVYLL